MSIRFRKLRPAFSMRQPVRRSFRRPVLEGLEDRCLMATGFIQTNLVSDIAGVARFTDPNLVNPWGIALAPTGPFWIADNGAGVSTLYNGAGKAFPPNSPLVVTIPPPAGSAPGTLAAPTGIVFNGTADFTVSANGKTAPAIFLFATEDGTISGWNAAVDGTNAILEVDNSAVPMAGSGAVYKGLAEGSNATGNFLFATNFRAGTIDVFDKSFAKAALTGSFTDPNLPAGFAPFGIRNIGGNLFVTYALQNAAKHDDVAGPGNGFVDVFDTNGNLVKRFASQGSLNSPWGLALAPAKFGIFSNDLLIGDFGDGRINAFDPTTGMFLGQLHNETGAAVTINGLWGLTFGNGANGSDANTLYFTAGIADESHGLFGSLRTETPNERFVAQVHLDVLDRPADPTGLGFWSGQLAAGAGRAQVVLGIEGSLEYHALVVQNLYRTFLHRSVDASGLNVFTNFLANGGTIEQVEAALAGSPEYFQVRGGGTNDGFLKALYQDALNRAIDATGQAMFSQELASGTTRTQVATAILTSTEFRQDLVQADYQLFLHRAADSAGLMNFVNALNAGRRDEEIVADIVGSDEYFARL